MLLGGSRDVLHPNHPVAEDVPGVNDAGSPRMMKSSWPTMNGYYKAK